MLFTCDSIWPPMAALALQIIYLFMLRYARDTTNIAVKGLDGFVSKANRISVIIIAAILLSAAYFVSRAGHYGAQLVHIEGVGPQGKFLETRHK